MLRILNVWCTYRSVLVAILTKRFLFEIDGEAVGLMSLSPTARGLAAVSSGSFQRQLSFVGNCRAQRH